MRRYRMRPRVVDAIQFDGTAAGAERVMAWAALVDHGIAIRPRTEYRGWDDTTGYLELEVRDAERGCMSGDWVLITEVGGSKTGWVVDDATFTEYYEPFPD